MAKAKEPNLATIRGMNAAMARAAAPDEPEEPKRGRGRPKRGEGSGVINAVVGGRRHGVRLATSERAAIESAAQKERIAVSALLRRVGLVFALDEHARAQIKGSAQWPR